MNSQYLGWETMFLDVDNDGWLDVLAVNGHVYPEVDTSRLGSKYKEPRILYWNEGNGKFKDVSKESGPGCTEPQSSRGMAIGDLWNDGRISVVVNNFSSRPSLFVNLAGNTNHWLGIRTVGTKSNRDGIGARVVVFSGGRKYLSSHDLRLHFGLGSEKSVDRIDVHWPSGLTESFAEPGLDRFITLTEGKRKPLSNHDYISPLFGADNIPKPLFLAWFGHPVRSAGVRTERAGESWVAYPSAQFLAD